MQTGHKFHCLGYKKYANPGGSLSNHPNFANVMLPQCSLACSSRCTTLLAKHGVDVLKHRMTIYPPYLKT